MLKNYFAIPGIVKSMGLVFGDIGTSPIYTFTAIFLLIPPTPENVMGILTFINSHQSNSCRRDACDPPGFCIYVPGYGL